MAIIDRDIESEGNCRTKLLSIYPRLKKCVPPNFAFFQKPVALIVLYQYTSCCKLCLTATSYFYSFKLSRPYIFTTLLYVPSLWSSDCILIHLTRNMYISNCHIFHIHIYQWHNRSTVSSVDCSARYNRFINY